MPGDGFEPPTNGLQTIKGPIARYRGETHGDAENAEKQLSHGNNPLLQPASNACSLQLASG